MDLEYRSSLDVVELVMAIEEAFPDFKLPDDSGPEEILRLLRERLGDDDPDGGIAALVRRNGRPPGSRGGASAKPEE